MRYVILALTLLCVCSMAHATVYTWDFSNPADYWLDGAQYNLGRAHVPAQPEGVEDSASVFARVGLGGARFFVDAITGGGYTVANLNNPPGTIYGSLYLSPTGLGGSQVLILLSPMSWTGGDGNYVYTFDLDTRADYRTWDSDAGSWTAYAPERSGTFAEVIAMIKSGPYGGQYAAFFGPQIGMSNTFGTTFDVTEINLRTNASAMFSFSGGTVTTGPGEWVGGSGVVYPAMYDLRDGDLTLVVYDVDMKESRTLNWACPYVYPLPAPTFKTGLQFGVTNRDSVGPLINPRTSAWLNMCWAGWHEAKYYLGQQWYTDGENQYPGPNLGWNTPFQGPNPNGGYHCTGDKEYDTFDMKLVLHDLGEDKGFRVTAYQKVHKTTDPWANTAETWYQMFDSPCYQDVPETAVDKTKLSPFALVGNWEFDAGGGTISWGDIVAYQGANVLSLDPTSESVYIKPNENAVINLNVSNLTQPVSGLQAMLNFSSTYFKAGEGEVTVAAGGGHWNELIYNVWADKGDLDVAVGVDMTMNGGTQKDGKAAYMVLTPTGTEGVTQVVFRPDPASDPGLTRSTFLSGVDHEVIWPTKVKSRNIIIDGTAPTIPAITLDREYTNNTPVVASFSATDANGIDYYKMRLGSGDWENVGSSATIDPKALTDGEWTVYVKAVDPAGNESGEASASFVVDHTPPAMGLSAEQWVGAEMIPVAGDMGNAWVMADKEFIYMLLDVADTTDARLGENTKGNDQVGLNINPTPEEPWGLPCGLIFQTGADWNAWGGENKSSGETDGWKCQFVANGVVEPSLPSGVATKTIYDGGRRHSAWTLPLTSVAGDTLQVGGSVDVGDGNSYTYPADLNWSETDTYVSVTVDSAPVDVLDSENTTLQGIVRITVTAKDALSGLDGIPEVTLTNIDGDVKETPVFYGESPEGVFSYAWLVTASTLNGEWTLTAAARDRVGNVGEVSGTLVVNKNQITGTVTIPDFVGASRAVAFSIDGATPVTKTLKFRNEVARYKLVDVNEPASLSAKTAWTLRQKTGLEMGDDGQAVANFTLRGGDLDGSNSINILDYSLLKVRWLKTGGDAFAADINGDGIVNIKDYEIMKSNWFQVGDLQ